MPAPCRVLAVSVSGFRAWADGGIPDRLGLTDTQALALARAIHQEVRQALGARRMHAELKGRGYRIGLPRVERFMRKHGIRARHERRFKATTDSKDALPVAGNLLDRQFALSAPNQVWTGNVIYTHILRPTRAGYTWRWCWICSTAK
ncbi:MAG: putative transposase [Azoarcus sp.]|nr:putative transposase [Azoarcus sp.]